MSPSSQSAAQSSMLLVWSCTASRALRVLDECCARSSHSKSSPKSAVPLDSPWPSENHDLLGLRRRRVGEVRGIHGAPTGSGLSDENWPIPHRAAASSCLRACRRRYRRSAGHQACPGRAVWSRVNAAATESTFLPVAGSMRASRSCRARAARATNCWCSSRGSSSSESWRRPRRRLTSARWARV